MSAGKEERRLAAIMFTDMVGYSALTQRNESLALELLQEHRRLLRDLFPQFGGREVETTGDGFLVEFGSALEAAKCAIEIQRAIATRNLTVSPERTDPGLSLKTKVILAVGVLVFLNLLLAVVFLRQRPEKKADALPKPQIGDQTQPQQKSVAILPFVNMSADKADEYLSDGMTEELLNALTKVKGLRVPGRSSCFAFKGKNGQDIFQEVGEKLHVGAVMEGSVRKAGNQLRVTAQLINVSDGFHLWSEEYDRDMTNIFAIQSDIAARVASALEVQLGVQETTALAKKPTESTEAYRLCLLGRYHFAKSSQAGWTNAMNYFNEAIKVDPSYALAYCGLADDYGWMGGMIMQGKEAWKKEKQLAEMAVQIDPNLPDAHLSLGGAMGSLSD